MKIAVNSFPYTVFAETKVGKSSGKEYLSIAIRHRTKNKDGEKADTYINMLDERELLVLANLCNRAYAQIVDNKTLERFEASANEQQPVKAEEKIDDEIPFQ